MGQKPFPKGEKLLYIVRRLSEDAKDHEIQDELDSHGPEGKVRPGAFGAFARVAPRTLGNIRAVYQAAEETLRVRLRRELDPAFAQARQEHLDGIRDFIKGWLSYIQTPEVYQVHLDYVGSIPSEDMLFFEAVKQHLPFPDLWAKYASWKTKRTEYVGACKKLRRQIKESWRLEGVTVGFYFEEPVMRMISAGQEEFQFQLFVSQGHSVEEFEYAQLAVNNVEVLIGEESHKQAAFLEIKHEACVNTRLPKEYQKTAGRFLKSDAAVQVNQLLLGTRLVEADVRSLLEEAIERRDHVINACKLCPGQPRLPR